VTFSSLGIRLLDLANKNTGYPVKIRRRRKRKRGGKRGG
jgi:hypothetical protein